MPSTMHPTVDRSLLRYHYVEMKLTAADAAASDQFGWSVAADRGLVLIGAPDKGGGVVFIFQTIDGEATHVQVAKLTAADAAANDRFGYSVAIAGDTVVVGSPYDDDGGSNSGAAYVFRTTDGGATYIEVAKLKAADAAAYDYFGIAVAMDGTTIAIGATGDDDGGSYSGSVYVFSSTDDGATYSQVAKLTAADAAKDDEFGVSVAIDGGFVAIGARYDDDGGAESGAVYIFGTCEARTGSCADGATYGQVAKLKAADAAAGNNFGVFVAMDGNTVAIGARYDDGSNSGAVYIFRSDADATYDQVAKLNAAEVGDNFGCSVAINGGLVAIGNRYDDGGGSESGSVRIFRGTNGTYDQVAELTASDAAAYDYFGYSVALDGDTVVIGAHGDDGSGSESGAAYVFSLPAPTAQPTATFQPTATPQPTTAYPTTLLPPTPRPTPRPSPQVLLGHDYRQLAKLRATDAANYDLFGVSVAMSGDVVVVGSPWNDDTGSKSGSAYVFRTIGLLRPDTCDAPSAGGI